jgi:hypothetical protein
LWLALGDLDVGKQRAIMTPVAARTKTQEAFGWCHNVSLVSLINQCKPALTAHFPPDLF